MKQRLLLTAAARYVNVSNTVFMFSTSKQLYSTSVHIQVEGRIHHSSSFHLFYLSRPFVSVSSKGKSKCLPVLNTTTQATDAQASAQSSKYTVQLRSKNNLKSLNTLHSIPYCCILYIYSQ